MKVDWERIESLADMEDPGDVLWLKEIIGSLYKDLEDRIKEALKYSEEKDQKSLQAVLHQIKGVSANFGLTELQKIASEGESLVKSGNLEKSIEHTNLLVPSWEGTKLELKQRFPN